MRAQPWRHTVSLDVPHHLFRLCLFAALVAGPSVTDAQEAPRPAGHPVAAWLQVTGSARLRVESDHLLQRARVGVRVAPTAGLEVVVEAQDARGFGLSRIDGSVRDVLDLRHAFVSIGRRQDWLDVHIGRQTLAFGGERVIGAAEWGNTARVFDAARVGVHRGANRLDLFTSAVVVNAQTRQDRRKSGELLSGVSGSLGSLAAGLSVEPHLLVRRQSTITGEDGHPGLGHEITLGLRVSGHAGADWTYESEVLAQRGRQASSSIRALAWTSKVQRRFAGTRGTPTLLAEANYASGDSNPRDGVVQTFDQLYPTNHGIYGVADRVGRRNTTNGRLGLAVRPTRALTLKGEGHAFWLANRRDGLYAASGATAVRAVPGGAVSSYVGAEVDAIAEYHVSKHAQLGLQVGHLVPGRFLRRYDTAARHPFYCLFLDVQL